MASGGPPDTLNQRHFVAALMLASGYRQADIARTLGYHPNRLSMIATSPLFRAQVADLQRQLREATLGDAMAMIEREAGASVEVIVGIRDDAGEPGATRLRAANDLLDRHPLLSRRTAVDETRTLRVSFSAADLAQMARAVAPAAGALPEIAPVRGAEGPNGHADASPKATAPAPRLVPLEAAIRAAEGEAADSA